MSSSYEYFLKPDKQNKMPPMKIIVPATKLLKFSQWLKPIKLYRLGSIHLKCPSLNEKFEFIFGAKEIS